MNPPTVAPSHRPPAQQDLCFKPAALPAIPGVTPENVAFLMSQLAGQDWQTAQQIGERIGWTQPGTPLAENEKRWLRACASASAGQIAGGQKGYKLIKSMTAEEYAHWRNAMMSQSDDMKRRVIESDRVFFGPMRKVE